jgi:hypothetical protein
MTEEKKQSSTEIEINVTDDEGGGDYMHPEQCDEKNLKKGKDAEQIQKEIEEELKKKTSK